MQPKFGRGWRGHCGKKPRRQVREYSHLSFLEEITCADGLRMRFQPWLQWYHHIDSRFCCAGERHHGRCSGKVDRLGLVGRTLAVMGMDRFHSSGVLPGLPDLCRAILRQKPSLERRQFQRGWCRWRAVRTCGSGRKSGRQGQ